MVHEQGEVIDSIESNIESTTVQVASGTDQLRQVRRDLYSELRADHLFPLQAAVYQNKARRKKIILALIGLVILGNFHSFTLGWTSRHQHLFQVS